MNDMKPVTGDIKAWLEETAAIAGHPIYVTDDGVIKCGDARCPCDDGTIGEEMPGRRHAVECFVEAVALHREWWGKTPNPELLGPPTHECASCKRRATRHDGQ